ncbi:hypothetical protein SSPIM334S_05835 [Streptomyces spiroverticillatus]
MRSTFTQAAPTRPSARERHASGRPADVSHRLTASMAHPFRRPRPGGTAPQLPWMAAKLPDLRGQVVDRLAKPGT